MKTLNQQERRAVMEKYDADRVRVCRPGTRGFTPGVNIYTNELRGDGGRSPWWMYLGTVEEVRRELIS